MADKTIDIDLKIASVDTDQAKKDIETLLRSMEKQGETIDTDKLVSKYINTYMQQFKSLQNAINSGTANSKQLLIYDKLVERVKELASLQTKLTLAENGYGDTLRAKSKELDRQILSIREIARLTRKQKEVEDNYIVKMAEFYRDNPEVKMSDEIAKSIDQAKIKSKEFEEELRDLNTQLLNLRTQSRVFNDAHFDIHNIDKLKETINEAIRATTILGKQGEEAGNKISRGANSGRNSAYLLARSFRLLKSIVDKTSTRIGKLISSIVNGFKKAIGVVSTLGRKLKENTKEADRQSLSFSKLFKYVLQYGLGIRSLYRLFNKLRQYGVYAFQSLALYSQEVNKSISDMATSFNQVKASIATMLQPITQVIFPIIAKLLSYLSQVMTYLGMIFAYLTGQNYIYKAKVATVDYAKNLKDAAGNAKELNKQLQGFDELNNLTTNENKNGGADALDPGDLGAKWEKMDIDLPDWLKRVLDWIKSAIKRFIASIKEAWDAVKNYVITGWKKAITSVAKLLRDVIDDFLQVWAESKTIAMLRMIFEIIGNIGFIISALADNLRNAWNYMDLGLSLFRAMRDCAYNLVKYALWISELILDWVKNLNFVPLLSSIVSYFWSLVEVCEFIGGVIYDLFKDLILPFGKYLIEDFFPEVFRLLEKFNHAVDWDKLRATLDEVWKALEPFAESVGQAVLNFFEKVGKAVADFVNSDEFHNFLIDISNFLKDHAGPFIENVGTALGEIITDIAEAVKKFISSEAFQNFMDWLGDWMDAQDPEDIKNGLEKLAIGITTLYGALKLLSGLAGLTITVATIANAIKQLSMFNVAAVTAEGTAVASSGAIATGFAGVAEVFGMVTGGIAAAVGFIISMKNAFSDYMDLFKSWNWKDKLGFNVWSELAKLFADLLIPGASDLLGILQNIANLIADSKGTITNVKELFSGLKSDDSGDSVFNKAKDGIKGVADEFLNSHTGIKNTLDLVKQSVSDTGTYTSDTAHTAYDNLKEVFGLIFKDADKSITDTELTVETHTVDMQKCYSDFGNTIEMQTLTMGDNMDKVGTSTSKMSSTVIPKLKSLDNSVRDSFTRMENVVKAKFTEAKTTVTDSSRNIYDTISTGLSNAKTKISDELASIYNKTKSDLEKYKEVWKTAFNNIKTTVSNIMSSIAKAIRSTISDIFSTLVEDMNNSIQSIVKDVEEAITKLKDKLKEVKDALGGDSSSGGSKSSSGSSTKSFSVPKLASGAVIPPNREFLAVLGDQRSGTNIEAPLSTIVDAVNKSLDARFGSDDIAQIITLLGQIYEKDIVADDTGIFKTVRRQAKTYKISTGSDAFSFT